MTLDPGPAKAAIDALVDPTPAKTAIDALVAEADAAVAELEAQLNTSGPVVSVNGLVGEVVLDAAAVGAAPVDHTHPAADLSDATPIGLAVLGAVGPAAARTAIGAGTSNLGLGATATTAAPGNHTHPASGIPGVGVTEIRVLTQAAYDALATKSGTTLYLIQG